MEPETRSLAACRGEIDGVTKDKNTMPRRAARQFLLWLLLLTAFSFAYASEGKLEVEYSFFSQDALSPVDQDNPWSFATELHFDREWNDRADNVVFIPFARIDENNSSRAHADVRELLWTHINGTLEIRVGVGREHWGVTEFFHLIDTINQTSFLESFEGEEKLGQPLVAAAMQIADSRVELWWLPYFRERQFAADGERFQLAPFLNSEHALYESGEKRWHDDIALRWSGVIGSADIGIAWFDGTARDPRFVPNPAAATFELVPYYEQIEQFSADVQWATGDWLWKFEGLQRRGQGQKFSASTGGLEYSFIGLGESQLDLGVVLEYMHDSRGADANHFFQRDIGLGLRLAFNNTAGSELLVGLIDDRDSGSRVWSVDFKHRFHSDWALSLEAYFFDAIDAQDILYGLRNDDYVRIALTKYF